MKEVIIFKYKLELCNPKNSLQSLQFALREPEEFFFISVSLFLSSKKPQIIGYFRGGLYESRYIGQRIYRLTDITFSMLLNERRKVITRFGRQFI